MQLFDEIDFFEPFELTEGTSFRRSFKVGADAPYNAS
jgi:hypothetical protein